MILALSRHLLVGLFFFSGVYVSPIELFAQGNGYRGALSPSMARRHGLERMWYTQVELDGGRDRVAHSTMHVSSTRAQMLVELTHQEGVEIISERDLDPFGRPRGREGAQQWAEQRVKDLKAIGLEAELETRVIPEITLYVVTERSIVHAIDAETGRTRWVGPVGKRNHLTMAVGASDQYVAVVNGLILYVLDNRDGTPLWQRPLGGVPGGGPAVSDTLVFVPMLNGGMESFSLERQGRRPEMFRTHGRVLAQPTLAGDSVAWPTERGYFYVGNSDRPGARYRLETYDTIESSAAHRPPHQLFVTSMDGYVYCIHEELGRILWRYSVGEPISHSPVVLDASVLVLTNQGNLFRLDADSGKSQWSAPNVRQILAASEQRLYCLGTQGRIVILDAGSGSRLGTLPTESLDLTLFNSQTDRIYVGTRTGAIQCLRETQLRWPLIHGPRDEPPEEQPQVVQEEWDEEAEDKPAPQAKDPFGAPDDDPFGAPREDPLDAPMDDDPFGAMDDDPFGADPF